MSKFCGQCGIENKDDVKFCVSCGSGFSQSKSNFISASLEDSDKHEQKFTQTKSSFTEFYFSAQGRVSRQEFFFRGFMPITLLTIFVLLISNVLSAKESYLAQNMSYLVVLFAIAITIGISQVMISIKRFHDFNASGWWSMLLLMPLINFIALMVLFFKGSVNSENKYGNEIGLYKQTPLRWVLFVMQFILILLLSVLNSSANMLQNTPKIDSLSTQKEERYEQATSNFTEKEKLFKMVYNKKWGFIDENGNWIIKPIYYDADPFSEGLASVEFGEYPNTKFGFIDKKGNLVIQPIYDYASSFSEGLAHVQFGNFPNQKWGFIDKKGNLVIQPIYDSAYSFSEGLAGVALGDYPNKKSGFIDKKGNFVIQPIYDSAYPFSEGLASVKFGGKYGFIDKKGNLVIQPIYDSAYSFSEELAKVPFGGKSGFIDKKGNLVIQPIYDAADSFTDGFALVVLNKKAFYLNKKGEVAIEPKPIN